MVEASGFVFDNSGTAISGANIAVFNRNTVACAVTTTTTNACGFWTRSAIAEGRYDIRITCGCSVSFIKYDDEVQLTELDVATLKIRNPADTFVYDIVPAAIVANRTLNLPLITGTDTFAVLGLAQTFTTQQTHTSCIGLNDNVFLTFGTACDAKVSYDATNLLINPRASGTGMVVIDGGSPEIGATSCCDNFIIHPNVKTCEGTERDLIFQTLNATCNCFINVLVIKPAGAVPAVLVRAGLNMQIGTNSIVARGCTQPTNSLSFFNGAVPVGTLTDGASLYTKNVSCSAELHVMDEAGNETLLSPHDMGTGEWVFDSRNSVTGKGIHVRMEEMMKRLCDEFGWGLVTEYPENEV